MSKSTIVNENGFTHFAHSRCQQGCEPILVNYSRPIVNKDGFTPFTNGGCQSLLQSTRMGSSLKKHRE